jgi:hypothetical protein
MAKGENLQSAKVERYIVDATIKPPTMVVEGQIVRNHQLIWLTLIYIVFLTPQLLLIFCHFSK